MPENTVRPPREKRAQNSYVSRFKKRKDIARYHESGGEALVVELVQRLGEHPDGASSEQLDRMARQVAGDHHASGRREIAYLARTIVRQAIGCGYVHTRDGQATLTRKSQPLLGFAPEGRESPEYLPAPGLAVGAELDPELDLPAGETELDAQLEALAA